MDKHGTPQASVDVRDFINAAPVSRFQIMISVMCFLIVALDGFDIAIIGFIAPENYLPTLTFQVWTMLIIGGSGNNLGAILGGVAIWALWSVSGSAITVFFPPEQQARAAALQITGIGVLLSLALLLRPRGLLGERINVSRHTDAKPAKAG